MEQYNPNPSQSFNPDNNKKNLLLWLLVIFAALSVVFFSTYFVKKIVEEKKVAKEPTAQTEILPGIVCNFANNEAAMQKAKEDKSIAACECIQEENYKFRCREDAQNEAYYAQARAQFKMDFCAMIKNNSQLKAACESVVTTGIDYLKKEDPEYLANIYMQSGNYDGSIAILQGSEKVSAMLSLALSYAGKALYEHKEADLVPKALEQVEKAKTLEPNNPEVYRTEGYVYEIKLDLFKAIESYNKALEKDANHILSLVGRGHTYNLMGDLNKALEDFQKAAELDKDKQQITIYANLCRLQTSRDDLWEAGIKNCQIVINSVTAGTSQKSDSNQILADAYMKKGKYAEALIYLENAKTLNPKDPNLLVSFANFYIAQKDYAQAMENAQKATEIDPLKTTAYRALAYAYLMKKDYVQAEVKALKGLEVINKDPSLLVSNKPYYRQQLNYTLADVYGAKGDKEKEMQYRELGNSAMKTPEPVK